VGRRDAPASVTTPTGSEAQASICGIGGRADPATERAAAPIRTIRRRFRNNHAPAACGSNHRRGAAVAASFGLGLPVDDLELGLLLATRLRTPRIWRPPGTFGGDQPRARDAAVLPLVAADAERLTAALDGGVVEPSGTPISPRPPNERENAVDDMSPVARAALPMSRNCWCGIERPIAGRRQAPPSAAHGAEKPLYRPSNPSGTAASPGQLGTVARPPVAPGARPSSHPSSFRSPDLSRRSSASTNGRGGVQIPSDRECKQP